MTRLKVALLATLALAQIADLWTTNAMLHIGGMEANPVMAWLQHELGSGWAVPKLGIALGLVWLYSKAHTKRHMAILATATLIASGPPIWNVALRYVAGV